MDNLISRNILLFVISVVTAGFLSGCFRSTPKPDNFWIDCDSKELKTLRIEKAYSDEPNITKIILNGHEIFATKLSQCKVKDYIPTRATTRQLLSGFDDLVILSEEYSDNIFLVFSSASIDKRPIEILTYSFKKQDCVNDYIFWISKKNQSSTVSSELKELSNKIKSCLK